jgi:hypothetical protein
MKSRSISSRLILVDSALDDADVDDDDDVEEDFVE